MIIHCAPGGPVESMMAQMSVEDLSVGVQSGDGVAKTLEEQIGDDLRKKYGLDRPLFERFCIMVKNYVVFDFGKSYFKNQPVADLILKGGAISFSIGVWTVLLIYVASIPLGIAKAVRNGSKFDLYSSLIVVAGYALPNFLLAMVLVVLFAGGGFWSWFPVEGLRSDNYEELSFISRVTDYFWHIAIPVFSEVATSLAAITMLTKNAFLDEMGKQYVVTARAQGLSERSVLIGHVMRNALLLIVARVPLTLVTVFFSSSILIERMFSLNGLGMLGFEAVSNRDYPIIFATLYVFTLFGLALRLVSDIVYAAADPRIRFETQR
nr:ABC transporter permease subunit [Candidatus Hydrogenosomobacter endosymbioticus]